MRVDSLDAQKRLFWEFLVWAFIGVIFIVTGLLIPDVFDSLGPDLGEINEMLVLALVLGGLYQKFQCENSRLGAVLLVGAIALVIMIEVLIPILLALLGICAGIDLLLWVFTLTPL